MYYEWDFDKANFLDLCRLLTAIGVSKIKNENQQILAGHFILTS